MARPRAVIEIVERGALHGGADDDVQNRLRFVGGNDGFRLHTEFGYAPRLTRGVFF